MAPNLVKYINKTILVSIPPFCGDVKCRPYKLTGVEIVGLWLEGSDLASGFLGNEYKPRATTTWAFFIPYSQIACVVVGNTPPGVKIGAAAPIQAPSQNLPTTVKSGLSSTTSPEPRKKSKTKEE